MGSGLLHILLSVGFGHLVGSQLPGFAWVLQLSIWSGAPELCWAPRAVSPSDALQDSRCQKYA